MKREITNALLTSKDKFNTTLKYYKLYPYCTDDLYEALIENKIISKIQFDDYKIKESISSGNWQYAKQYCINKDEDMITWLLIRWAFKKYLKTNFGIVKKNV